MTRAPSFEVAFARRLRGARRVAVVGIGDELKRDDRLGTLAAQAVEALRLPNVAVFLAGTVPESFSAPIRRSRADHVVLLDAADMGRKPGTLAVINEGRVSAVRLSTHALPLTVFMEYVRTTAKAKVTLVGIQPDLSSAAVEPTKEERAGLARAAKAVKSLLARKPSSRRRA